jgi:hypothetical protein
VSEELTVCNCTNCVHAVIWIMRVVAFSSSHWLCVGVLWSPAYVIISRERQPQSEWAQSKRVKIV